MRKTLGIIKDIVFAAAVLSLAISAFLFMRFNGPIIKNDTLLYLTLSANLIGFFLLISVRKQRGNGRMAALNLAASLSIGAFLVYSLLTSMVIDYFQPLSLYDQVIYPALAGLLILFMFMVGGAAVGLIRKKVYMKSLYTSILVLLFLLQFYGLGMFQKDMDYLHISGSPAAVFQSGESGYDIFRIPTVLVVPEKSVLHDGTVLESDRILLMAEARRNGSLDNGDIDLVQKMSEDGGRTWSDLMILETYEPGIGKIGNSTPVFDSQSGQIILLHLSGTHGKMSTYKKISNDGGLTWSDPEFVYDGYVGPGHGIMITSGIHKGRLLVPGYDGKGSLALYSDDHGETWRTSEILNDGNEAQIAQVNDRGDVMMVVRTNRGVSLPHEPLEKLYTISENGGENWSDLNAITGIKEPICMSSIVRSGDVLYYSHPDDYYSRGRMTIAASYDEGKTFSSRRLIYEGASGYSELGVLSDGNLILAFEGGAVEYDEQIRFVRVPSF